MHDGPHSEEDKAKRAKNVKNNKKDIKDMESGIDEDDYHESNPIDDTHAKQGDFILADDRELNRDSLPNSYRASKTSQRNAS